MSLYHFDPRQAGTGAKPDVETYSAFNGTRIAAHLIKINRVLYADSEQSALRAAREAAGFGHVAEQPCGEYVSPFRRAGICTSCEQSDAQCACSCVHQDCTWPRAAHGKEA